MVIGESAAYDMTEHQFGDQTALPGLQTGSTDRLMLGRTDARTLSVRGSARELFDGHKSEAPMGTTVFDREFTFYEQPKAAARDL